jgi:hypothetical protein
MAIPNPMKTMIALVLMHAMALLVSGCATSYQPESFTGGFTDVMTAPDSALVTFKGNGYTGTDRVIQMAMLRCAELTLQRDQTFTFKAS